MYEELGIGERIDQVIEQDGDKRQVSLGQAVKAMVLNGRNQFSVAQAAIGKTSESG